MGARILTVIGTRPEAIKLFPVVQALATDRRFDNRVCTTGQHGDLVTPVLEMAGISANFALPSPAENPSLDSLLSLLLVAVGAIMDDWRPDAVLVQGDTASALAGALCAHHRRIPVCHVEAGLRTGDLGAPWPEEGNRKLIAAISALHCAPTERAREALLAENVAPDTVHVTGNTVVDALLWVRDKLPRLAAGNADLASVYTRFGGRRMVLVTCHRRETQGAVLEDILRAIAEIGAMDGVGVVLPIHPRPDLRAAVEAVLGGNDSIALLPPLDYPDFVRLLDRADIVLTGSGGVQEEAPAFGKPVLVLRETSERLEAVEAGSARLVGTKREAIVAATRELLDDRDAYRRMARVHQPFGDGQAAHRIVRLLAGLVRLQG